MWQKIYIEVIDVCVYVLTFEKCMLLIVKAGGDIIVMTLQLQSSSYWSLTAHTHVQMSKNNSNLTLYLNISSNNWITHCTLNGSMWVYKNMKGWEVKLSLLLPPVSSHSSKLWRNSEITWRCECVCLPFPWHGLVIWPGVFFITLSSNACWEMLLLSAQGMSKYEIKQSVHIKFRQIIYTLS